MDGACIDKYGQAIIMTEDVLQAGSDNRDFMENRKMRIAIIEDEQIHRDLLQMYIQEWAGRQMERLWTEQFASAEEFWFAFDADQDFDALFIDIQMPGMNGMELAKKVRKKSVHVEIVFTTGISDYLQEGYEVEALHYLLKPLNKEKVYSCLEKISSRKKTAEMFIVHTEYGSIRLKAEQVNYIEARAHRSVIGMTTGEKLEIRESITEMETLLPKEEMMRCHRSYLCRIENIFRIEKSELYFDNGSHIPVSRRLYSAVNQAFIQHFRRDVQNGTGERVTL